ncbi:rho-related GTP-binding protein RhoN isoform X2 [Moschus berezovskii]|nr:rho-related GTP-binding protein RhoN isoform X2 [Moschus berezovskii]
METESHDVTIVLFRKWMGAPARVLSSTPTFTRGHAEGPSLMRVQLPPYLLELPPNSAPIPGLRKSSQSNNPAQRAPKPQGPYHSARKNPVPGPRAPPPSSGPRPPAALVGGGAGGAAAGLGAGRRGGRGPGRGLGAGPRDAGVGGPSGCSCSGGGGGSGAREGGCAGGRRVAGTMEGQSGRCKIVVVGDAECGKTALLQVFAKDAYPGSYVPTVFENYTASFEIDKRRIELNMWDTSGSSYYDNVRPLAYPDSDAVLICFDISRPETLDSVLKKWQGETQEFCPNAKVVLVGCKLDMRTDLATLRELSKQRLIPVTHEQGTVLAKQVGAVSYVECSSRSSERSVRDVFHVATVASLGRGHRQLRRTDSRRGLQRSAQLAGRPDRGNGNGNEGEIHKDRAKSCNLM